MPGIEAPRAASSLDDRKHVITRQASIFAILRSLQKHRSPLSITFRGHDKQIFTSIVLKVDLNEGYFLLDELSGSGHKRAMNAEQFVVSGNDRGVQVVFGGNRVIAAGSNELVYYWLHTLMTS